MRTFMDSAIAGLLRRPLARNSQQRERRQRGLLCLAEQRASWYLNFGNVHTVVRWLLSEETDIDAARRIVSEVLEKPWKWRPEFCVARCRELDQREPL
jgi:hypothetical protein